MRDDWLGIVIFIGLIVLANVVAFVLAQEEAAKSKGKYVLCRDGWLSNSGGRQGACAWHGGIA
jgi:hypothetical protein